MPYITDLSEFPAIAQTHEFAQTAMLADGIVLDLCETPKVSEGWATYLGVSKSALVQRGGQSVKVRIVKKRVSQNETKAAMRQEILPRYREEIENQDEIEADELTLLGGLASREASNLFRGGECEAPIATTPLEWGILLLGQAAKLTRVKLGNLKKTDTTRRTAVVRQAAEVTAKIRTHYMGESVTPKQVVLQSESLAAVATPKTWEEAEEVNDTPLDEGDELARLIAEQAKEMEGGG